MRYETLYRKDIEVTPYDPEILDTFEIIALGSGVIKLIALEWKAGLPWNPIKRIRLYIGPTFDFDRIQQWLDTRRKK